MPSKDNKTDFGSSSIQVQNVVKSSYFESPHPVFWVLVPGGLFLTFLSWINPEIIPSLWFLGPIGRLAYYLGTQHNTVMMLINVFSWFAHCAESVYALQLCTAKGITDAHLVAKWGLQTFVFGIFSLKFLIAFTPKSAS